jgi:outer membrane protein assembly factor BamD
MNSSNKRKSLLLNTVTFRPGIRSFPIVQIIYYLCGFKMKRALPVFLMLILGSCSQFGKVMKSPSRSLRFNAAVEYYQKKDYLRALPLLEGLLPYYRGQDSSEIVYYYYAYCYYGMKDYQTASYHFQSFTDNFFNSKHQTECAYMSVYCKFMDANPSYLDQSETQKTIEALQLFINMYPTSSYVDLCNSHMDQLRATLRRKAYDNAYLYYKTGDYKAASVALKNVLKDYPDLEQKEETEFLVVRSLFLYAQNSVDTKKTERYQAALEEIKDYREDNNPQSGYWDDIAKIEKQILRELENLRKLNI